MAQPASAAKLSLSPTKQLMLEAAEKVTKQDFEGALKTYNQVLAADGSYIQAYLQRSVVKRELKDTRGSRQDAAAAVRLSEAGLRQKPGDAKLYYERGTGFRLLGDYAKAKENIRYAIYASGGKRKDWEADMRAIDLEEKMAR